MRTCSATKKFSNTNIAIKKEGIDRIATTITAVVIKMSLPASQLATQLATQSTTELATHLANQLITQKTTTQVANKTVTFEYRRCLAKFLFNSQLYYYIRESHSKKIVLSTVYSIFKNLASPHTTRLVIILYSTHQTTQ